MGAYHIPEGEPPKTPDIDTGIKRSGISRHRLLIGSAALLVAGGGVVSLRGTGTPNDGDEIVRVPPVFTNYKVSIDENDRVKLLQWKRDIDIAILDVMVELEKPLTERDAKLISILGDSPSETDIILYSIGKFLLSRRIWEMSSVMNTVLIRGESHIRDFDTHSQNCILTCVITNELAEMYGIHGRLVNPINYNGHFYWEQLLADGHGGRIVDTYWCAHTQGFVENADKWDDTVMEELRTRGRDTSRMSQMREFFAIIR